ncbi:hypothetical protein ORL36_05725 [Klebsiella pasteurii]|uniref:hypothetical protein n=1 Tax=Klebsiella TaxID=570 RepID=UPI002246A5D9|nr:hypothetical protein [Klebsiella pasteurii]MCW9584126.1 hypothetical protein [Klebsiella pasteurii]
MANNNVLERKAKIYLYGPDGLKILTPRHCGELYQHVEALSVSLDDLNAAYEHALKGSSDREKH